ncbi:hypothetical protein PVL29_018375 [Vitis rotundifolia]|uniref:AAA+ ATPase domain-containing protein n=1 Tax=Vitis rotundifolia TaxID=103349 RepID=A0AA38Z541_VITRO|nr:hypothetical protein PVL29_018375 [Vitis rotundifolia]
MVEIIVSVAAKVSEYLVDPVVRQLGYLFNYRTNIEDLSQKVEKLRDARARQQHSVDEAIGNGHIIEDDVCKWMKRADGFIQNACKFLEDEKEARKSCFNGLCPNLNSRYQLSREARKKAGVSVQILADGQFEKVSYRAPLQGIRSAPSEALESRMLTLNEVMEALRDANINRIGVWGLGGVGKSTLVKQVAEQAEQEKLFRKVVMVPVFQTPDFKEIQQQIADKLGMKFEEVSEQGRADRLHQRIKQENTILIILDDLWAELKLEKVGIPSPDDHKGCKLVLTSRNKQVLSNEMSTQKDFRVRHLQEDETWILFKNTAGDSIENPELQPIAVDVAKECAGLPIAIVTVAKALKNKNVSIWKDALQQLKSQTSTNISGMETKVYSSLKLSYEHLEGDEAKSSFLLCGLFSNYIYIRDLLKYGMGLRLFQGTNTLEEAKNRIDTLVDNLKSSNLLLETGHNAIFRMHDFVRSTARKIVSEQHHVFTDQKTTVRVEEWPRIDELQKVTWVSLDDCDVHELPEGLVCPKLELFICLLKTNSAVQIPNNFFEQMKQLKVLDLSRMQLPSLPVSLHCLTNLRTLCLDICKLGDIGIIAELKKLEILSLMDSDIEQLPREIAQLTHLRLFDLKGSDKLKVIPPNVISSLFRLEDLRMENSFTQWEGEGKSNACLAELKHLSHLTSLDIQIPDAQLLPKDLVFDNLVRYRIFVGDVWSWDEIFEANSTLKLNKFDTSLHLVDGISKLLKRTEDLRLRELCGGTNVLSKLNGEGFLKLKHLNVESSPEIQYIMNSMDLTSSHGAFPVMETLSLNQLINLQEVCHGQFPAGSFGCLRKVQVEDCDGLKFLFSLSVARGLSQLVEIKVTRCKSMVEMVVSQERKEIKEDAVNVPLFPELRYLTLEDLPKLSNFCFEENPVLSKPASTIVGPSTPPLNQPEIRDSQLLLSLGGNLRSLKLKNCMSLLKLFPPSLLQNLEELIVENCGQLEHVFDLEGLNVDDGHVGLLLKLGEMRLIGLPKLRHICNCGSSRNHFPSSVASAPVGNIIFPKLSNILLESLPNLTSFVSPGYHSLQRLHHADLDTPFPVLFDERVAFPNLEELILGDNRDTEIWPEQFPVDSFPRLRVLRVYDYKDILVVIPSFMLQRLHNLEVLKVGRCSSVKEVFQLEGLDEENQANRLARLREIELHDLPELTHLWKENSKPGLDLQSLEILDEEIRDGQLLLSLGGNLRSLKLKNCMSLLKLFPPSLLQNLEELIVENCGQLEHVFDLEGLNVDDGHVGLLLKLGEMRLIGLPKLRHICNCGSSRNHFPSSVASAPVGNIIFPKLSNILLESLPNLTSFSPGYHSLQRLHHADLDTPFPVLFDERVAFPSLKFLFIRGLDNVKKIWHNQIPQDSFSKLEKVTISSCGQLLNIFPSCMLKRLQSLDGLVICDCSSLEAVFDMEWTNVNMDCSSLGNTFVFPKVTFLSLISLHQLRSFYPGALTLQWPLLKKLMVYGCHKLNVFVFETPTFQQRHREGNLDMPLFLLPHVAFANLEELRLGDNRDTEIWPEQSPVDSFPRLRVLYVDDCRGILVVIPSFMLQRLHNLEVLKVGRCSSVKEVFQLKGLDEENQAKRLGLLREIELHDLLGLTHLWKQNSKPGLDLQSLESLEVWNCVSLINLVPSSVSFQNLATLDVQSCGSLRSLISPSVAKSLVKLKTLKIRRSDMMEEVVANEGGEATYEITFYKLQHMELLYLSNLTSFSSGGYIFSLPSLEQMLVKECPKMKMFSSSLVTTPRLERITVGDDDWPWQDDLNTTIHNSFINAHGNIEAEIVELEAGSAL